MDNNSVDITDPPSNDPQQHAASQPGASLSCALTIARKRVKSQGMSAAEIKQAAQALLASERGASIRKAAQAIIEA